VIRGEDHVHNTAKQILIFEGLGAQLPEFAHAALIFDLERRKLSKRIHGEAVHVDRYRIDGYMPEAMVNYLAQMSWTPADGKELFSLEEACRSFDITKLSKSPAVFDVQRLNWFNSHYLRSLPLSTITERAMPYLQVVDLSVYTKAQLEEIVGSVRDGLTILSEILGTVRFYFEPHVDLPEDLKQEVLTSATAATVLDATLKNISKLPFGDHKGCKTIVDNLGKELGIKGKDLYWPLRVALSGKVKGPDLGSIISILGPERVKDRLGSALSHC
jgi:nondiscriminating glutamyl-tRNA synthetase